MSILSEAPGRFEPPTPPPVNLDQDGRRRIVAGVKAVMARLHEKGLLADGPDYAAAIADPDRLHRFIETYRRNRLAAADLVVDRQGQPVLDDDGELVCGVTLPQVERLLVTTCARKLFESLAGAEPARSAPSNPASGSNLRKLLGGRGDAAKTSQPPRRLMEAQRKLEDLRPLLGFSWQLPLLRWYAMFLERHHLAELGPDLLLLREPEGLKIVAALDAVSLRQARRTAGPAFREVLATAPAAVANLAWLPPKHLEVLRAALRDRLWRFCARDRSFVEAVLARDPDVLDAVGPVLADLPIETLAALEKLPLQRIRPFLNAFFTVFGSQAERMLADARFARAVLPEVIASLLGGSMTANEFTELAYLKLTALKSRLDAARRA